MIYLTLFLQLTFVVPERILLAAQRPLPQFDQAYNEPLTYRREHTATVSVELQPSMIPFVTQFRVEKSVDGQRKVLITYAHINHNKVDYDAYAEISNNFVGDLVGRGFTKEAQIGAGIELTWFQWNKVSHLGS